MIVYFIPVIGALLGWSANRIMLNLLFRRAFPARQQQIANQLGTLVARDLFNLSSLVDKVKDPSNLRDIAPFIDKHIEEFLHVKLKEKLPVISMFVSDSMLGKIKEGLLEEIEVLLPQVLGQFADKMVGGINIEKLVAEKVSSISAEKLESMIYQALGRELRLFTLTGAFIGFITGVVAIALVLFMR